MVNKMYDGSLYRCGFVNDGEIDFKEYIEVFSNRAAERFAYDAWYDNSMWEHSTFWDGEYAIKVIDENDNVEIYNINVEMIPEFNAEFVKKEKQ